MASFPGLRLRRLRATPAIRALVAETRVHPHDLVAPLFVVEGRALRREIKSMPGQFQFSLDRLAAEAAALFELGVPAVMLFGIPDAASKTPDARMAYAKDGLVQKAVAELKRRVPGLSVFTDLCLCEYTTHGHCGVLEAPKALGAARAGRVIANDPTSEVLARIAVSQAGAGADWVAPSDMMDGRVAAIRRALDLAGHSSVGILSYAAKSASAFYGPFREAAASAPAFGDRRNHQMDPGNGREAMREIEQDLAEGADMVMVKPALPCLDLIREARERFSAPLAAYNVSGEYSMVHAAAQRGWGDLQALRDESLGAIKRAGAGIIVTYWARSFAEDYRRRRGLDHGY
jgi:porphobilinogen synthase